MDCERIYKYDIKNRPKYVTTISLVNVVILAPLLPYSTQAEYESVIL